MSKPRILIVDDESAIAGALQLCFTEHGFDVTVVADGHDALQALNERHFDSLILDLEMPRVSGADVLRILSISSKAIPVIVMTGPGHSVLSNLPTFIVCQVFHKPFSVEAMVAAVTCEIANETEGV